MTGWLLDTNVVSELRKKRPDSHVKAWSDAQAVCTRNEGDFRKTGVSVFNPWVGGSDETEPE